MTAFGSGPTLRSRGPNRGKRCHRWERASSASAHERSIPNVAGRSECRLCALVMVMANSGPHGGLHAHYVRDGIEISSGPAFATLVPACIEPARKGAEVSNEWRTDAVDLHTTELMLALSDMFVAIHGGDFRAARVAVHDMRGSARDAQAALRDAAPGVFDIANTYAMLNDGALRQFIQDVVAKERERVLGLIEAEIGLASTRVMFRAGLLRAVISSIRSGAVAEPKEGK